jgi:hypothetical protein
MQNFLRICGLPGPFGQDGRYVLRHKRSGLLDHQYLIKIESVSIPKIINIRIPYLFKDGWNSFHARYHLN